VFQTIDLLGFVTLGLLGGFGHCVGMCAPFVLFVGRRGVAPGSARALAAQAWYTLGRVTTYAALGAAAGAVGGAVQLAGSLVGIQRAASVVAGAVLVAWSLAVLSEVAPPLRSAGRAFRPVGTLFGRVAGFVKDRAPGHPFAIGLFLGLLPCGLLYSAVIAAVARGGALQGAAALALFGLGTAPALLGLSLADHLLSANRALINRLSQVFILAMGLWFLWRGLTV
jgi:uncharacterized protein